jgi:hypothetical protein
LKYYFQQPAQSKLSKDKKPKPVSNATPKPVLTFPLLESSLDQSTQKPRKGKFGLIGENGKGQLPMKEVHVRSKIVDMVASVYVYQVRNCISQSYPHFLHWIKKLPRPICRNPHQVYVNESAEEIEAKYKFPLDSMAAVCGFEAFVNGKHVVGKVKEKVCFRVHPGIAQYI